MDQTQYHFLNLPFSNSLLTLLLGFIGAMFGIIVILFGYPFPKHPKSLNLILKPEFLVWIFLIILLTSLLTILPIPLWHSLKPLRPFISHHKFIVFFAASIIIVLVLAPFPFARQLSNAPRSPLQNHSLKMFIINFYALITVLPIIIGIQLTDIAVQASFSPIYSEPTEQEQLNKISLHIHYRRSLQWYISIMGILIAIVTLATGALRNLVIATGVVKEDFPITLVLIYGLYYTALLILIYTPPFFRLTETGKALRDQIAPLTSIASLSDVSKQRHEIDTLLQLKVTSGQSVRTAVAILSPLLSAFLAALLS